MQPDVYDRDDAIIGIEGHGSGADTLPLCKMTMVVATQPSLAYGLTASSTTGLNWNPSGCLVSPGKILRPIRPKGARKSDCAAFQCRTLRANSAP